MKGVIFDLDGTLIDSMVMWRELDKGFLEKHGYTYHPEISHKMISKSLSQAAEVILREYGLDMSVEQILKEWEAILAHSYASTLELKPHAKEMIELMHQKGIPMCVATLTEKHYALSALERLGVLCRMEFVLTVTEVGKSKRDPDIYLLCAEKMGVEPEDCVVMEDTLHALLTAKKAGFIVYGIDDAASPDSAEIEKESDLYVRDFSQVIEELET